MKETTGSMRPKYSKINNAAVTINLSATGSKKAPNAVVCFQRRANQPSNQSVTAANIKITAAIQSRIGSANHWCGTKYSSKNNGITTIRSHVRAKGKLKCIRSEEHTSELQSRGQLVCRLL